LSGLAVGKLKNKHAKSMIYSLIVLGFIFILYVSGHNCGQAEMGLD